MAFVMLFALTSVASPRDPLSAAIPPAARGAITGGQAPDKTALRKLEEETCVVATEVRALGVIDQLPATTTARTHLFPTTGLWLSAVRRDDTEVGMAVHWQSMDWALAAVEDRVITLRDPFGRHIDRWPGLAKVRPRARRLRVDPDPALLALRVRRLWTQPKPPVAVRDQDGRRATNGDTATKHPPPLVAEVGVDRCRRSVPSAASCTRWSRSAFCVSSMSAVTRGPAQTFSAGTSNAFHQVTNCPQDGLTPWPYENPPCRIIAALIGSAAPQPPSWVEKVRIPT
ncbi:hypothetical protein [Streptomyces sp. NPDC001340]